jgi:hypothetical protein
VEPCVNPQPPNKAYTLSIKALERIEHAVIVRIDGKKETAYKTRREGEWYTSEVREWGRFAVTVDTTEPRIAPSNFKEGGRLKSNSIRLKISDNLSGIDTYGCYLNGSWILAEYDGKSASLSIDANGKLKAGRNELRVVVTDVSGNTCTRVFGVVK